MKVLHVIKGLVPWNTVFGWTEFHLQQFWNPRPLDQQASAEPIKLPGSGF